jgi:hypothetical protein
MNSVMSNTKSGYEVAASLILRFKMPNIAQTKNVLGLCTFHEHAAVFLCHQYGFYYPSFYSGLRTAIQCILHN